MKKYLHVFAATATLVAGSAFAQANDPRFTGTAPAYPISQEAQAYGNSGWTVDQAYGGNGYGYGPAWSSAFPGVLLSDGRWADGRYTVPQYPRTRSDRDGDGVPNWNDRYPDDPRYR